MTSRAILSAGGAAPQVLLLPDRRDDDAALRRVRSFHLGGDPGELEAPDAGALPALLWAYRDPGQVRTSFPLFLEPGAAASCEGLVDRLRSTLEAVAPGGTARILEDNLIRLEHLIAEALAARDRPVEAGD